MHYNHYIDFIITIITSITLVNYPALTDGACKE